MYYYSPIFRQEDQGVYVFLPGVIPQCHCVAQDAHVGGACCAMAQEIAHWVWADG